MKHLVEKLYYRYKGKLLSKLKSQPHDSFGGKELNKVKNGLSFECSVMDPAAQNLIQNPVDWCNDKISRVLNEMYPDGNIPMNINSVSVMIYPFDGVGYTVNGKTPGSKTVHISSKYIASVQAEKKMSELDGVTCHELVHAFQYDGDHTAPHGFIEGLADFYRIKVGLAAKHWNPTALGASWDAGYEKTGYFLLWLDLTFPGSVNKLNLHLKNHRWYEGDPFKTITGYNVDQLFQWYKKS